MKKMFDQIQDIYEEILRQKERALSVQSVQVAFDEQDVQQKEDAFDVFMQIQKDLKLFFSDTKVSQEVFYALIGLVDEIFLHLSWPMTQQWKNALLEMHFFSTQMAGEVIYQRIDHLIKHYDTSQSDLALVYFLVLSLGFKGQYQDYPEKIHVYIKALYTLMQREYPKLHKSGVPFLVPQCYDAVLDGPFYKGLPDMRMWHASIASVIIFYVFSTYVLWYNFVSDVYVFLK
jgi:type VI secretion system protein ImpK